MKQQSERSRLWAGRLGIATMTGMEISSAQVRASPSRAISQLSLVECWRSQGGTYLAMRICPWPCTPAASSLRAGTWPRASGALNCPDGHTPSRMQHRVSGMASDWTICPNVAGTHFGRTRPFQDAEREWRTGCSTLRLLEYKVKETGVDEGARLRPSPHRQTTQGSLGQGLPLIR